ncbi:MAG: molybdenum cofactor guanylyltransferase [Pseudomonadota bacterium]
MKIAVVVLAGGEGRRIGGNKPLRLLGDRSLLDRAVELGRQWSDMIAVAVRNEAQVKGGDCACVLDDPTIAGPLGGLVAALRFARDAGADAVLTLPADMPFLPDDLLGRLDHALGDRRAAIASSGGQLHPVCGLWLTAAIDGVPNYLASHRRSLSGFAKAVGYAAAEWPAGPNDPFFNINSADDLAVAEARLRG